MFSKHPWAPVHPTNPSNQAKHEPSNKTHTRVCAITMAPLLASTLRHHHGAPVGFHPGGAFYSARCPHIVSVTPGKPWPREATPRPRVDCHCHDWPAKHRGLTVTIGSLAKHARDCGLILASSHRVPSLPSACHAPSLLEACHAPSLFQAPRQVSVRASLLQSCHAPSLIQALQSCHAPSLSAPSLLQEPRQACHPRQSAPSPRVSALLAVATLFVAGTTPV